MFEHEFDAAQLEPAPPTLPERYRSAANLAQEELTILISVHPDCPCTAASLEQIDRFMVKHSERAKLFALVQSSENRAPKDGNYWQQITRLPNATPIFDQGGTLAAELGIIASGATAAYDASGTLRFQGGLTASRGHAGSSKGLDALEALASATERLELCSTPAFGCPIEAQASTGYATTL